MHITSSYIDKKREKKCAGMLGTSKKAVSLYTSKGKNHPFGATLFASDGVSFLPEETHQKTFFLKINATGDLLLVF